MANIKTKSVFTLDINQEECIALYEFLKMYATNCVHLSEIEANLRLALSSNNLIE
jgi:hypothetical protein